MGKLVVTEFVSVDGVFEDPGGVRGFRVRRWTFEYERGDDGNKFKLDELMGRRRHVARPRHVRGLRSGLAVPRRGSSPTSSTPTRSTSSRTRSRNPEWQNTTVISGDVVGGLKALKERDRRRDPRPRKRHARPHAARERPRRRAPADGLPDDPRPRQAPLPGRDRPAQVHAGRGREWSDRTASRSLRSTSGPAESAYPQPRRRADVRDLQLRPVRGRAR